MMWTNDPEHDFWKHDVEAEEWMDSLPRCSECGEPIQPGDYYYIFDGERYCENCMDKRRKLA